MHPRALPCVTVAALFAACDSDPAAPRDGGPDVTTAREDGAVVAEDVALGPLPPRQFIRDAQGRAMVLHGVNVDSHAKSDPARSPRFEEADAQRFRARWGFNFVRYLIFWDALEPTPGHFDAAYLDRIATRLDWFARNDISVLLDMHQDVYATRFCCDGAPAWAIHDDGLPFALQAQWFANYFQPAVQRAFDNFWGYAGEHRMLQDHYGDAWAAVATRFHDHPAVLGYDLFNEPSPGSRFEIPEALTGVSSGPDGRSARFIAEGLAPFYQRTIQRIRAVDPDRWIFVEPHYGGPGNGAETFFPTVDDPRAGDDRVVFAPHLYSVAYENVMRYDASDGTVARWESARRSETRRQSWPIVAGEFGMDATFPGADRYLEDVLQMTDRMQIGWAYWSWDPGTWGFWNPTTQTESANIEHLVRVYPQRIAGEPVSWSWDLAARRFTLAFTDRAGVTGATEVFVPAERFFAGGYAVTSDDPAGSWTQRWDAARQVLSLDVQPNAGGHRFVIAPR